MLEWLRKLLRGIRGGRYEPVPAAPQAAGADAKGTSAGGSAYASDAPISLPSDDRFRRWPFAQRVAQTIATLPDPSSIVIGIYGAWGEGKTTVLNFIEHELSHSGHVVCLRFNPWNFSSDQQILRSYFESLADALGRSAVYKKEHIGEALKKYGGILVAVPGLGNSLGKGLEALGSALSTVGLAEQRQRIETLLEKGGVRVTVLMDDIDRLNKSEIQTLFRLVKLTGDFKHTAYVLAFDDEMVAAALQEQYPGKGVEGGKSFLEKIVQVPLHLPQAEPEALRSICFQGVEAALNTADISISNEEATTFAHRFTTSLEMWVTTPRMAKRYGNALAFSLPLVKGEVNTVDFLLMEGLRVLRPDLFGVIRDNPDAFLCPWIGRAYGEDKAKERSKKVIENALKDLPADQKEAAERLIREIFPRVEGVLGNTTYGPDWEKTWAKEKRVASQEYFKRYFVYGVPARDVADREIEDLLLAADKGEAQGVTGTIDTIIHRRNAETLISKLRKRETTCSANGSETLAMAIGQVAAHLPRPPSLFPAESTSSQASILVSQLLRNIPAPERVDVAKRVLLKAEPLPFAAECLSWMHVKGKEEDPKSHFSDDDIARLGKALAERVQGAAANTVIYKEYPDEARVLLSVWATFGSEKDVRDYLHKTVSQDRANAAELLKSFTGHAWSAASPVPHKADFERQNYDSLAKFVDTDLLHGTLQGIYGDNLESSDYPRFEDRPVEERIARQFAWIHRKVKEEQGGTAAGAAPPDA